MIVRITRGRVRPNSESAAFDVIRRISGDARRPDGLEDMHIGRREVDGRNELLAVSVWRDIAAVESALGSTYAKPSFVKELDPYVEDLSVELYDTVVDRFEGLRDLKIGSDGRPALG